jgi:hypothetical protein
MSKTEKIARTVEEPSVDELSAFRAWFAEFDADACDRQFEAEFRFGGKRGHAVECRHRLGGLLKYYGRAA